MKEMTSYQVAFFVWGHCIHWQSVSKSITYIHLFLLQDYLQNLCMCHELCVILHDWFDELSSLEICEMHLHLLIRSMCSSVCCLLITNSCETCAKFPVCTPFSSQLIWVMQSTLCKDSSISLQTKIHEIYFFHATCEYLPFYYSLNVCMCASKSWQVCVHTVKFGEEESWSTSQMPPSKGRLFLASTPLTLLHGMNRTESRCVPPYGRSDYKAVQICRGIYYRVKSKTKFQQSHMKLLPQGPAFLVLWCFNNEAALNSPTEAVMFKWPLSSSCFVQQS